MSEDPNVVVKPEAKKRPGRQPSPLTAVVNNFKRSKAKVESLNDRVVKVEARLNTLRDELDAEVRNLANAREELDRVLGTVIED